VVTFLRSQGFEHSDRVQCALCSRTVADLDEAQEAEWFPSFYDYHGQERGPVCPVCIEHRLVYDPDTSSYDVVERLN